MPKELVINGTKIRQGEDAVVDFNIARLPTYTVIDLPVYVYRGQEEGPVLLLTGGLHGDEINGVEIIRRMMTRNLLKPRKGTILAMPLVNIYGFIQNVRGVPDGKDINRSFPGVKTGSLARLVAHTLMNEIVPRVDYGLDFHTGGASRSNYPQLRGKFDQEPHLELGKAFAAPYMLHSKLIKGSFRHAAHQKKKPILVFETGEAMRLDEFGIQQGMEGTLRLMKHLGMREDAPVTEESRLFMKSSWVRAKYAGLFRPKIQLGEDVKRRQTLGYVSDPFGSESFKVTASHTGTVIGLNNSPVIHKGDALMHIAHD